jgi:hypothetical protein
MCKKVLLSFLLFFLLTNVHADNMQRVDVKLNNISLREFFSYIEKNYPYTFMYDNTEINDKERISVNERNQPITNVLASVLKDKGISYEIQGYQIILSKKDAIDQSDVRQAGRKTVTGKVLDENGDPVIGANIVEKGTTNGTVTNINGDFYIDRRKQCCNSDFLYRLSGTGGQLDGKEFVNIVLQEDSKTLMKIVVVAMGQ